MLYRTAFDNVVFLGTRDPHNGPELDRDSQVSLSKATTSIMITLEDRIIVVGVGSGLVSADSSLFGELENIKPVSILMPHFDCIMAGFDYLMPMYVRSLEQRMTIYMPKMWVYPDSAWFVQRIKLGKIKYSCLKFGKTGVHQVVEKSSDKKWSGKVIASYCVLNASRKESHQKKVIAYRIGDTLFAPTGKLMEGTRPSGPCLTLLRGIKNLVTNCTGVRPNLPASVLEGNTPEEIVSACEAAGCTPDIYLINRFSNDEDVYDKVCALYAERISEHGIVSLASDVSMS